MPTERALRTVTTIQGWNIPTGNHWTAVVGAAQQFGGFGHGNVDIGDQAYCPVGVYEYPKDVPVDDPAGGKRRCRVQYEFYKTIRLEKWDIQYGHNHVTKFVCLEIVRYKAMLICEECVLASWDSDGGAWLPPEPEKPGCADGSCQIQEDVSASSRGEDVDENSGGGGIDGALAALPGPRRRTSVIGGGANGQVAASAQMHCETTITVKTGGYVRHVQEGEAPDVPTRDPRDLEDWGGGAVVARQLVGGEDGEQVNQGPGHGWTQEEESDYWERMGDFLGLRPNRPFMGGPAKLLPIGLALGYGQPPLDPSNVAWLPVLPELLGASPFGDIPTWIRDTTYLARDWIAEAGAAPAYERLQQRYQHPMGFDLLTGSPIFTPGSLAVGRMLELLDTSELAAQAQWDLSLRGDEFMRQWHAQQIMDAFGGAAELAGLGIGAGVFRGIVVVAGIGRAGVGQVAKQIGNVGRRFMRMPKTATLPPKEFGWTLPNGDVVLARGLTRQQRLITLRHESVHSWFIPKGNGVVARMRQTMGQFAYDYSNLLRYMEEAIAEGYAWRSVSVGLRYPIAVGEVTVWGLAAEAAVWAGGAYSLHWVARD